MCTRGTKVLGLVTCIASGGISPAPDFTAIFGPFLFACSCAVVCDGFPTVEDARGFAGSISEVQEAAVMGKGKEDLGCWC